MLIAVLGLFNTFSVISSTIRLHKEFIIYCFLVAASGSRYQPEERDVKHERGPLKVSRVPETKKQDYEEH